MTKHKTRDRDPFLSTQDLHLFNEGTHTRLYERLGAHPATVNGVDGYSFAVWAPNADRVSVVGDFNGWDRRANRLQPQGVSGIWHGFVPGVARGTMYKYAIRSRHAGYRVVKADPFAFLAQVAPETASVTWDLDYEWGDGDWMASRAERNSLQAPISVYEVHLGSWRHGDGGHHSLSYRELGPVLADYLAETGFTHVEFLPLMEHPFYGSWGYQTSGYFAATSRYGDPQDLMYLVDYLHQRGFGVILDWVPSHFATDEHSLGYFDGTHLYEHADPRRGFHPDWKSHVFNYGRNEVRSFLLSSAHFWMDAFHVDGLRVDAVASMLYRDYSRKEGEWVPNQYGGREDLEAIAFLRQLNETVYGRFAGVQMFAEESTAWPMVSRPTNLGGLGFGLKWDMGWMHDTLTYMQHDPIHRRHHHSQLSFRGLYAFNENFVLPLSHDEVVHGKRSLLARMPGDDWQKFANLRLMLSYMWATPGKKLLFMGGEFGQRGEWDFDRDLDWDALLEPRHAGVRRLVSDLNRLYREHPALHELDCESAGFEWIDIDDAGSSVVSLLRRSRGGASVACVFNFTPVPRPGYRLGVPQGGWWHEVLNSDATDYSGSGQGNMGGVEAAPVPAHGRPASLVITLPPLAALFFAPDGR